MRRRYIPLLDACAATQLSKTTMYGLIAQNRLRRFKVGRKTYLAVSELEALFGGDDD
ncbi:MULTISPECIES: helix-turn-helix domain-containing protein [unclassified Sphingomonas]|uniref:helix-turn-helix domain-containing protein n=1 Tax=unclassified Sphingomonas TaxID=196159 RepID=UPI003FA7670C